MASRLRKEPEICLSPQRKSFNTGCSVQAAKVGTISGSEISNGTADVNHSKQTLQRLISTSYLKYSVQEV